MFMSNLLLNLGYYQILTWFYWWLKSIQVSGKVTKTQSAALYYRLSSQFIVTVRKKRM